MIEYHKVRRAERYILQEPYLIFFENSTRTRLSFELAEKRLSADVLNFTASSSSVSKGETLIDTVNNILAMKVDMIVMRHPKVGAPHFLSKHVKSIIINAGDGAHEHPTQALLDAFYIREKLGNVEGKKVVIVGDILHSRVALSNIFCLKMLGAEVKVCGPLTLIPKYIEELGVTVETDLMKALQWCDVANMLRIQLERQDTKYFPSLREYSQLYGLTKQRLDSLDKEIVVMHPGSRPSNWWRNSVRRATQPAPQFNKQRLKWPRRVRIWNAASSARRLMALSWTGKSM